MLFCHLTTRVTGDKYPTLLSEKKGTGFPYLVFLDADGNLIAKAGERTVAAFQKSLKAIAEIKTLESKQNGGDKSVGAKLLIAKLQLGTIAYEEAKTQRAAISKLDASTQQELDQLLTNLEFSSSMQGPSTKEVSAARQLAAAAMFEAGRCPDGQMATSFYSLVMTHAEATQNVKLYEQALNKLKQAIGANSPFQRLIEQREKVLEKMKASETTKK